MRTSSVVDQLKDGNRELHGLQKVELDLGRPVTTLR